MGRGRPNWRASVQPRRATAATRARRVRRIAAASRRENVTGAPPAGPRPSVACRMSANAVKLRLRADEEPVTRHGRTGERHLSQAVLRDFVIGVAGPDDEGVPFFAEEEHMTARGPRRRGE